MADFDVRCGECGEDLSAEFVRGKYGGMELEVTPCKGCGEAEYEKGREQGKKEGEDA